MTKPGAAKARRILLGEIVNAHGIRGEIVIRSYTAAPEGIGDYGPLEDESGARRFEPKVKRVTPKGVVATIAGVADRTAAEMLKGTKLYVARDKLPAAEQGEYYHADLVGLAATDPAGVEIGQVLAVHNFGAGDILEIRLSSSKDTALVPFTDASVPEVDIAAGRVTIIPPTEIDDNESGGG